MKNKSTISVLPKSEKNCNNQKVNSVENNQTNIEKTTSNLKKNKNYIFNLWEMGNLGN